MSDLPNTNHLKHPERVNAIWLETESYFPYTSYHTFKTHVLPILESELTPEKTLIYQDTKLPENSRTRLQRFHRWAWSFSTAITVAIPWQLAGSVMAYRLRDTFGMMGLSLMHKHVLLLALGLYLPLYPFTAFLGDNLPLFNFSKALTSDLHSDQLALYRKRLVEARPDLMTKKYQTSRLMIYDDVELAKPIEVEQVLDNS